MLFKNTILKIVSFKQPEKVFLVILVKSDSMDWFYYEKKKTLASVCVKQHNACLSLKCTALPQLQPGVENDWILIDSMCCLQKWGVNQTRSRCI
jgi:hypothetical protein